MHVQEMIRTHPHVQGNLNETLARCIDELYDCAQICTSCADACLGEQAVEPLKQCIRLNLDCGDVCAATGAIATRRTGSNEILIQNMLESCALACRPCGEECESHAEEHQHCRICAEACRRCEQACHDARNTV
jgi:hypothetical protein